MSHRSRPTAIITERCRPIYCNQVAYCSFQIKSGNPVKSAATLRATITHLDAGNCVR